MSAGTDPDRLPDLAAEQGLPGGRMLTLSKSAYRRAHPAHVVAFNASITDEAGSVLWWGDLDLTLDEPALMALAATAGVTLCVFFEGDVIAAELAGRQLLVASAVASVTPGGEVVTSDDPYHVMTRDEQGRLVRRRTTDQEPRVR